MSDAPQYSRSFSWSSGNKTDYRDQSACLGICISEDGRDEFQKQGSSRKWVKREKVWYIWGHEETFVKMTRGVIFQAIMKKAEGSFSQPPDTKITQPDGSPRLLGTELQPNKTSWVWRWLWNFLLLKEGGQYILYISSMQ